MREATMLLPSKPCYVIEAWVHGQPGHAAKTLHTLDEDEALEVAHRWDLGETYDVRGYRLSSDGRERIYPGRPPETASRRVRGAS